MENNVAASSSTATMAVVVAEGAMITEEAEAETFATSVMEKTRTMRDIHNRLVRPIVVTLSGPAGSVLPDRTTISKGMYDVGGNVTGGSDPLERNWWVKRPGMSIFEAVPASVFNDGRGFHLNAAVTGEYTLRLHVRQPGSNLPEAMRQIVLNAVDPRMISR